MTARKWRLALAPFAALAGLVAQPLLAQQIVSERWGGCAQTPGHPPVIGANGSIFVANWHPLKDPQVLDRFLARALREGFSRCPTGNSVGVSVYIHGLTFTSLVDARWSRRSGQWQIDSRMAMFAQREEQAAAAAKARRDREEQAARRREEAKRAKEAARNAFVSRFKPDAWANPDALMANVFLYKDKVVGVRATFEQMVAPGEAVFGRLYVTDVPGTEFVRSGQEVVLALRITGLKVVRRFGMDVNIPQGRYVGSYPCRQSGCRDFFD